MNKLLSKRIILSPDQLQRLLGREKVVTDRYAHERDKAIISAVKGAPTIGAAQAYAQFSAAQQRHLHQAAKERNAPLELIISEGENINNNKNSGEHTKKKKKKANRRLERTNTRKRVEEEEDDEELGQDREDEEDERFENKTPRIKINRKRKRDYEEEEEGRDTKRPPSAASFSPLSTRSGRQRLTPRLTPRRRPHPPLPWLRYGEVG